MKSSDSMYTWPHCPVRGFLVNPKRACSKCKHKKHIKWMNDKLECVYKDAGQQTLKKRKEVER